MEIESNEIDVVKRKSVKDNSFIFIDRKNHYRSTNFHTREERDTEYDKYIKNMKIDKDTKKKVNTSSYNIFYQLEKCKFDKNITLEECNILMRHFPRKTSLVMKVLLNRFLKKKKEINPMHCYLCRGIFERENLIRIDMHGDREDVCFDCNKHWMDIKIASMRRKEATTNGNLCKN